MATRAAGGHAMGAARDLRWQRSRLPAPVRALVLEDQQTRNELC